MICQPETMRASLLSYGKVALLLCVRVLGEQRRQCALLLADIWQSGEHML